MSKEPVPVQTKRSARIRIVSCIIMALFGLKAGYFSATRVWSVEFPWTLLFMVGYAAFGVTLVWFITRNPTPPTQPKRGASEPPKDIHATNGVCRDYH